MLKSIAQVFFLLILVVGIGYLASKLGFVAYQHYALQREINNAKARVGDLQKSTEELRKLIAQLGNKDFLTVKIKEELNVKEPGEKVAIIKNSPQPQVQKSGDTALSHQGFFKDWWNLFFGQ